MRKEIKDWQLILELSLFVTHCMSAPSLIVVSFPKMPDFAQFDEVLAE